MRTLIHRSSALRASTDAYGTGILADAGMLSEPSIFGQNVRLVQWLPKNHVTNLQQNIEQFEEEGFVEEIFQFLISHYYIL